ncbi:MAG: hypothetical protein AB7F32_01810 [Victivallaceae bacterium]
MKILFQTMLLMAAAIASADQWRPETRMIYGRYTDAPLQVAAVTFSDWYAFKDGVFGAPGVRAIINEAAAAGIDVIMWRSHGGGVALYPTQVDQSTIRNHASGAADYGKFDSFAEARDFTRRLGQRLYIWITPLEEAHAQLQNSRGRYTELHPELREYDVRTAAPVPVPSFYFPAYRRYKSEIFRELVRNYDPEAVIIDFERRGSPPRSATQGYLPEALLAFNRQNRLPTENRPRPDDLAWQKFRAEWVGEYLREARRAAGGKTEIIGFVHYNGELTSFCDARGWLADGTLDSAAVYKSQPGRWGHAALYSPEDRQRFPGGKARYAAIYLYAADRKIESTAAASAVAAGFTGLIWMESANLNGGGYALPRSIACPDRLELVSPEYDLSRGGTLRILSAGDWILTAGSFRIAGRAGGIATVKLPPEKITAPLRFAVTLKPDSTAAGLAVEGEIGGQAVSSIPSEWNVSASRKVVPIATGMPGVPPFLDLSTGDNK